MNFNLDLARKALRDFSPIMLSYRANELDLSWIVDGGPGEDIDEHTLYVMSLDDALAFFGEGRGCSCHAAVFSPGGLSLRDVSRLFSFAGDDRSCSHLDGVADSDALCGVQASENGVSILALREACSSEQLILGLSQMKMRLTSWSESILTDILQKAPLQSVFEKAATAFGNPIMASNAAMRFMFVAGPVPNGFSDPLWDPAINVGECPLDLYFKEWTESKENAFESEEAYFVGWPDSGGRRYLFRNLIYGSEHYGSFEIVNVCRAFSESDLALADYFGDILSRAFHEGYYEEMRPSLSAHIDTLIFDGRVNEAALFRMLSATRWNESDSFHVSLFSFSGIPDDARLLSQQARRCILQKYPRSFLFDCMEGIVAIARSVDYPILVLRESASEFDAVFPALFSARRGVSSDFIGFSNLPIAYSQALFALKVSESTSGRMSTCFYDDCFFEHICHSFKSGKDSIFAPPAPLSVLASSDAKDGTEYLETILAYLENGCSAAKAAESLGIHRNTLAYRLKRIAALSGIDFENSQESSVDFFRLFICCKAFGR